MEQRRRGRDLDPTARQKDVPMRLLSGFLAAVTGLVAFLPGTLQAADAVGPQAHAPAGVVRGVREGETNVFRAIPYARPPVGALRWRPPVPMPRWSGVRR